MNFIQDNPLDLRCPRSGEAGSQDHIGQNLRHGDKNLAGEWVIDALICCIDRPARSALHVFTVAGIDFGGNLDNG